MGKYKILRDRQLAFLPGYWNGLSQTSSFVESTYGAGISKLWMVFQNGRGSQFYLSEERETAGKLLLEKHLRNRKQLQQIFGLQLEAGKKLVEISDTVLSSELSVVTLKDLIAQLKRIRAAWLEHDGLNVFPWFLMGDFLSDYLHHDVKQSCPVVSAEDFHLLSTPAKRSFSSEEEFEATRLAFKIAGTDDAKLISGENQPLVFDSLSAETRRAIDSLVQNFFWVPFGYDGPTAWGREHYLKRLNHLLSFGKKRLLEQASLLENYEEKILKTQKKIIKNVGLLGSLLGLFDDLKLLSLMTDQRKEFTFHSHVAVNKLLVEISSRLSVPLPVLKHLLEEEVSAFSKEREKLLEIGGRRINSLFVVVFENGSCSITEGDKALALSRELFLQNGIIQELKGRVGSRGKNPITKGAVRVLFSPNEVNKMKEGEILVATMTSPDFVPAMRKAAAIITDEGGVTCHAAIVSRELGIPCIIATHNATKVLRDGDLVVVDTENGTVKKL